MPFTSSSVQSAAPGLTTIPGSRTKDPAAYPALFATTAGENTSPLAVVDVLRTTTRWALAPGASPLPPQLPPVSTRTCPAGMVNGDRVPSAGLMTALTNLAGGTQGALGGTRRS